MHALRRLGFWLPLVAIFIWGLLVLLWHQDTTRETAFTLLMFIALASSLNILLGYTGYVSFGHIVFFGLGGYFGFYLLSQHNWGLLPAALAGGVVSALIAGLLGLAILRLRGAYFALATIGINEAARAFVDNFSPFGGATGMFVNFSAYKAYGGAGPALWYTFTCLWVVTMAVLLVSYLVKHSRFGLGLMAIREDEDAAMVMGVKAPRAKTIAFMLSAFAPGMIGVLYFFKNGNVEPGDAFQLHMSIEMLVMVMLGGMGTVSGPLLGAVTYEGLKGYLLTSPIFKSLHLAVAGIILLLIILFVPAGAVGWVRSRLPRLRRALE
jgi:branched-chain amino acid transport system permease protein